MKCVLCKGKIEEQANGWKGGHNPSPVSETGRCCSDCNETKVIPARLGLKSSAKLTIDRISKLDAEERFRDYISDMGTDDVCDLLLDPSVKNGPQWLLDQLSYGEDLGFIEVPDSAWLKQLGGAYYAYVEGELSLFTLIKDEPFYKAYLKTLATK